MKRYHLLSKELDVEKDLIKSESSLNLLMKNRQISSPALLLEQERLSRDLDIQKNIFLTLKQQLELAKIEAVQESVQIRQASNTFSPKQ